MRFGGKNACCGDEVYRAKCGAGGRGLAGWREKGG